MDDYQTNRLDFIRVLWICIALNFFLLPHSIASAGVGSIGYLIETGLAIDRHLIVWGINLIMLGLAFLFRAESLYQYRLWKPVVSCHISMDS